MTKSHEELKTDEDDLLEDELSVEYNIATYPSDFTLNGIKDMLESGIVSLLSVERK